MSDVDVTLIVCGAPLTARTPDLVRELLAEGWRPTVVATPSAAWWLDGDAVESLIGEPPRTQFRSPSADEAADPLTHGVVAITLYRNYR